MLVRARVVLVLFPVLPATTTRM